MNANIIIDLGFGDSGKGLTTDYKCMENPISTMVVRFSGGHQVGHTVQIGNKRHVFSNFGSGTLRDVPSYFSEHCTIYPPTMLAENDVLLSKLVIPEFYIHPLVKLTTPADVAYNRYLHSNHGTCGLGIGATMNRNLTTGYKLYGVDLLNIPLLKEKLKKIYEYYLGLIHTSDIVNGKAIKYFYEEYEIQSKLFEESIEKLKFNIKPYSFLKSYENLIFEGSQGIMLDMDHGIFPNVTYSNTTSKNAIEICDKLNVTDITVTYVTRCYQTRHGNGWMSETGDVTLINNEDETNVYNEWQKEFRVKEIDYDLLRYSLTIDDIYSSGLRKELMVTCLDQRPGFIFEYNKLSTNFRNIFYSNSPKSEDVKI